MRACGLALEGELLALASASHSGEDFHVTGVRKILASAGLSEDALQCPPALPLDEAALWRFLGAGGRPDRVHMNCSGKHAAMLATCVTAGWPTGRPTGTRTIRCSARSRRPSGAWRARRSPRPGPTAAAHHCSPSP